MGIGNNMTKPTTIRMTAETKEKLSDIAKEFENQDQVLSYLIQLYEIEKSKSALIDHRADIEAFEMHTKKIIEYYHHALLIGDDKEALIQEKFRYRLEAKDEIIQNLQEDKVRLENQVNICIDRQRNLEKEIENYKQRIAQLEKEVASFENEKARYDCLIKEIMSKNKPASPVPDMIPLPPNPPPTSPPPLPPGVPPASLLLKKEDYQQDNRINNASFDTGNEQNT